MFHSAESACQGIAVLRSCCVLVALTARSWKGFPVAAVDPTQRGRGASLRQLDQSSTLTEESGWASKPSTRRSASRRSAPTCRPPCARWPTSCSPRPRASRSAPPPSSRAGPALPGRRHAVLPDHRPRRLPGPRALDAREQGRKAGGGSVWGSAEIGPEIAPTTTWTASPPSWRPPTSAACRTPPGAWTSRRWNARAGGRTGAPRGRVRRGRQCRDGGRDGLAPVRHRRPGAELDGGPRASTSAALLTPADVAIAISFSGATARSSNPPNSRPSRRDDDRRDGRPDVRARADRRRRPHRRPGGTTYREGPFAARQPSSSFVDCLYVRVAQLTFARASAAAPSPTTSPPSTPCARPGGGPVSAGRRRGRPPPTCGTSRTCAPRRVSCAGRRWSSTGSCTSA